MSQKNFIKLGNHIRNIYNQEEIQSFIHNIIEKKDVSIIYDSHLYKWLTNNLKNYLLSKQKVEKITNITGLKDEYWVIEGFKNNTLSNVILDIDLKNQVEHIVDYYLTEKPQKSLNKVSFTDALNKSIQWTSSQKKVKDDPFGTDLIIDFEDDFSIVKINSEQSIDYESSQMNHCLGFNHKHGILNNEKQVFSLRDPNNVPHVTIMLDNKNKTIVEIKGNSNQLVKYEYQKYLPELLNNILFDSIDRAEFKSLSNINFNKKLGRFEFQKTIFQKEYNFQIDLSNTSIKNDIFYRTIFEKKNNNNFFNTSLYKNSLFFNVILHNITSNDLSKLEHFNIKNLKLLYNDNQFNFSNTNIETLDIKIGHNVILTNFNLDTPNLKDLTLIVQKSNHNSLIIDLTNSKVENLHLENINLTNLVLPSTLSNLVIKNSHILNTNLSQINCKEISCDSPNISLKANRINLIDSSESHIETVLGDNIKCHSLYTSFSIKNIHEINDKNLIAYNGYNINYTSEFESLDPLKILYTNGFDRVNKLTHNKIFDISKFKLNTLCNYLKIHSMMREINIDVNLLLDYHDTFLHMYVSPTFEKLPLKEQKEIILYETLSFMKGDKLLLNEIKSILSQPISVTLENHINIVKKDMNYTNISRVLTQEELIAKKEALSKLNKTKNNLKSLLIQSLDSSLVGTLDFSFHKELINNTISTNKELINNIVNTNTNFQIIMNNLKQLNSENNLIYFSNENLSIITKMFFNNVISPYLPNYYDKHLNSFKTEESISFIRNKCSNFIKEYSFINKDKFFDFIIDSINEFESMNKAPKTTLKVK